MAEVGFMSIVRGMRNAVPGKAALASASRAPADSRPRLHVRAGFTLVELLLVLVVIGIVLGIGGSKFRGLENELQNATMEAASFFRQARTSAMARTSAYRVVVTSTKELRAEFANSCAASTWSQDTRLRLDLQEGVVMQGTPIIPGSVLLCYSTRGVANASPTFELRDRKGNRQRVDLFMGGAVQTTPIP